MSVNSIFTLPRITEITIRQWKMMEIVVVDFLQVEEVEVADMAALIKIEKTVVADTMYVYEFLELREIVLEFCQTYN